MLQAAGLYAPRNRVGTEGIMQRSLKDLENYRVSASNGEIGRLVDVLMDDEAWVVRYLVVATGNFLHGRHVLVSPLAYRSADWARRELRVALTVEQVEASPDISEDEPVSRQREAEFNQYYGYPHYWNATGSWGLAMYPSALAGTGVPDTPLQPPPARAPGDAHLRSAKEVREYDVHGSDGSIGHINDFIANDATWRVRYFVIDTSSWWFGKRVLVAPQWATRISWDERAVFLSMSRQAIQESPEWHATAPINREYERRLYDYYGRPVYWESETSTIAAPPPPLPPPV